MKSYKGFDKDFKCLDFQYEVGKTYETEGKPVRCGSNGFHACKNPFDVFAYYNSGQSRFAIVEQNGNICEESGDDTKVASSKITIETELSLPDFIRHGMEYVFNKIKKSKVDKQTSGYESTAATSDSRSTAATSGSRSTAATSGDESTAATSGSRSTAATSGYESTAEVNGKNSIACASGLNSKAKACEGSAIVLCDYDDEGNLKNIFSYIAGKGRKIKPDTWYTVENSKVVECK